jgi:MoaA/NifB/PqqE/SkfB family radical SAM enzyme
MKTWAETYDEKKLSLIVEASTFCNAKCPQCARTDRHGTLGKSTTRMFDLNSWSLEDFKSYFNVEDLNHLKNIHFSGTYGDPGMCKDIDKIIEYIFDVSTTTKVSMNSNGSMRDPEWWHNLGKLDPKRLTVTLDVDGTTQEMHEKYRRNTNLSKVLDNLEGLSVSGAKTKVLTIIFKHNEDYFDDIVKMVNERGCFEVLPIESNRFKMGDTWDFRNEYGEKESLEQATNPRFRRDPKALSRRTRDWRMGDITKEYDHISCVKAEAGSLQILNTTQVYPCCYLGTGPGTNSEDKAVWQAMINGGFNLKEKTLKEICYSDWYQYHLFDSFENEETAMHKCKRICGYRSETC